MGFGFGPGCCCTPCVRIDEKEWTSVPIHNSYPGVVPASTWLEDWFSHFSMAGGELLVSTPDTYAFLHSKITHPPDGYLTYKYGRCTGKIRGDYGDGIYIPLVGKGTSFGGISLAVYVGDEDGEGGFLRMCNDYTTTCCSGKFASQIIPDGRDIPIPVSWGIKKDTYFTFETIATSDWTLLGTPLTWVKLNGNYVEPLTGNVLFSNGSGMLMGGGTGYGLPLETIHQANDVRFDDILYQTLGDHVSNEPLVSDEDYNCPPPTDGVVCCEPEDTSVGEELFIDFGAGGLVGGLASWCDDLSGIIAMTPEAGGPQYFCELGDYPDEIIYTYDLAATPCPEGSNQTEVRAKLRAAVSRCGCCGFRIELRLQTSWGTGGGSDDSRHCDNLVWVMRNEGDTTRPICFNPWTGQTSVELIEWEYSNSLMRMQCCYQPPLGLPDPIPRLCTGTVPSPITVSWAPPPPATAFLLSDGSPFLLSDGSSFMV